MSSGLETAGQARQMALIWLVIALTLPVFVTPRYWLGADSGHYVELSSKLAQGERYEINGRPETKYPPGFPLLLAPAALVSGNDFTAIARWAGMLASLVFPVSYLLAKRRASRFAIPFALATIGSVTFLNLATGNPMSDLTFAAASLGFLVWSERFLETDAPKSWRNVLLGAVLLTAAVAIRSVGIAAIATFGLAIAIRWINARPGRRWIVQSVVPLGSASLYFMAWSSWTSRMRQPWYRGEYMDSYTHQMMLLNPHEPELGRASLTDVLARVLPGLETQAAHAGELFTQLPWIQASWSSPLVLAPLLLVLLGMWREIRSGRVLMAGYVAAYTAIVVMWPFDEGRRFLFPLFPALLLLAGTGVAVLVDLSVRRYALLRGTAAAIGGLSLIGLVAVVAPEMEPSRQQLMSAVAWGGLLLTVLFTGESAAGRAASTIRAHDRLLVAGLAAVFVAIGIVRMAPESLARAKGAGPADPTAAALEAAATWLASNTSPSTVIQSTFNSQLHFASKRRVVPFPITADPALFREVDSLYNPQYLVVLDPTEFTYYRPLDRDRFTILRKVLTAEPTVVHTFPGGSIYVLR